MADFKTLFGVAGVRAADPPRSAGLRSCCSWRREDVARERAHEVLARFVLQSDSSFAAPSTAPGRTHPTTYVIATRETDASVAAQEAWAANADYVVRLPAAHMLQLSRPDELAETLGGI